MTFYTESVGDQTNHFAYAFVLENFAYGYSVHEYFPDITRHSVWCSHEFYQTK